MEEREELNKAIEEAATENGTKAIENFIEEDLIPKIKAQNRQTLFKTIEDELKYQNEKWENKDDSQNSWNDWLAYIEIHADRAKLHAYNGDETGVKHEFRKIAALAIACMEHKGFTSRKEELESFKVGRGTSNYYAKF